MLTRTAKIFIAGHQGLVGSALVHKFRAEGFDNLILRSHSELDLTRQVEVEAFFAAEKPQLVCLAAAKVGGIHANSTQPGSFIRDNLAVQTNVLHAAWQHGVERLLFLGSSCVYPRLAPQPMVEEALLTGLLEPTNESYALAKISGLKMCAAYNYQYGTRFLAVMPTNLYGPGDNFHLTDSHVLPALIRRFHTARQENAAEIVIWGSGQPLREFLYVDDLAAACFFVLNLADETLAETILAPEHPTFFNVGSGEELSIADLAHLVARVVGYSGRIVFDPSKPDGMPRKVVDASRLARLGWKAQTRLKDGLRQTYQWYVENFEQVRL